LSKYRAKKDTRMLGKELYEFDSRAEASYFDVLVQQLRENKIRDFSCQPRFELTDGFTIPCSKNKSGKSRIGSLHYSPDFRVTGLNGEHIIIEVKGMITKDYRIRLKLFLAKAWESFGVTEFIEVIKGKETRYITKEVSQ